MRFKCKNRHRVNLYINNPTVPSHGFYHHIGHSLVNQINGRNNNGTPSPKRSPTSSTGSGSPSHASPRSDDLRNDNYIDRKRKCDSDDEHGSSPKRAPSCSPISVGSNSPIRPSSPVESRCRSPMSKYRDSESSRKRGFSEEETGSAFHRVERRPAMDRAIPRTSIQASLPSVYPTALSAGAPHAVLSPAMLNMNALDKGKLPHNLLNAMYRPAMTAGFGKLMPGVPMTNHFQNENGPLRAQRNALMMDLQNIENDNDPSKLAFMRDSMSTIPPMYRSPNPMVGKMLTSAPPPPPPPPMQPSIAGMGLAQNWCAKCNASFRMTSDLVYHMRSHHKREFDPVKKKRDEKLKCDVCGETFKERHHLTRHMTSHS